MKRSHAPAALPPGGKKQMPRSALKRRAPAHLLPRPPAPRPAAAPRPVPRQPAAAPAPPAPTPPGSSRGDRERPRPTPPRPAPALEGRRRRPRAGSGRGGLAAPPGGHGDCPGAAGGAGQLALCLTLWSSLTL